MFDASILAFFLCVCWMSYYVLCMMVWMDLCSERIVTNDEWVIVCGGYDA